MRSEKIQMVQEVMELVSDKPVILITYQGLSANAFNVFRAKLSEAPLSADCRVVPNRLLRVAAEQLGLTSLAGVELSGDTALISSSGDAVALAKAVRDLSKGLAPIKVKLGHLEGTVLSADEVQVLADLPSREILLSQLLGLLQAPATQLVRVLNASAAKIVYALNDYYHKQNQPA